MRVIHVITNQKCSAGSVQPEAINSPLRCHDGVMYWLALIFGA